MVKILVFSDSHGDLSHMRSIISENKDIDFIIHLGDYVKDIREIIQSYKGKRIEYVKGNNDLYANCEDEYILRVEDVNIFLTHGHRYNVKNSLDELAERSLKLNVDVALFGHTHCPFAKRIKNVHLINPGSISQKYSSNSHSYCILTIHDSHFEYGFPEKK